MIWINACRGLTVQFYLDAVCLGTRDVDSAALHPEVLLTMQTIFLGTCDVECQILDLHILFATDGMSRVANYIQSAFAFQFKMSLGIDASLPTAICTIRKCIGTSVFIGIQFNALAVIDVDGRTRGIVQRHAYKFDGTLVTTTHLESSVIAATRELVGDFTWCTISNVV